MENKKAFDDVWMMGIEGETYQDLLSLAKKQNKSVVEVASEALKRHVEQENQLKESTEKKVLMEG